MYTGKSYSFWKTIRWSSKYVIFFIIYDTIVVCLHTFLGAEWLHLPWQPISLIGIAVSFYLGFKNNSSYDRMWEARKIWGGIVNASRSFTVMARDFVNNDSASEIKSESELAAFTKSLVHRHVAWLHSLALEMRKMKSWEHKRPKDNLTRDALDVHYSEEKFDGIKPYLSSEDFDYVMSKGNRSSHSLSLQSKSIMDLRRSGHIEHFRHLEMQSLITEFYTLQGKSERIKNFPFPRQYASMNVFFVVIFIALLPFGMLNIFHNQENEIFTLLAIPFSIVASWVFWMMEMIGDYSENPFEGLHNDIPIRTMARGIEIDIRQMIDETELPEPMKPMGELNILV